MSRLALNEDFEIVQQDQVRDPSPTNRAVSIRSLMFSDAVRVGQRCTMPDPVGDLTAVVAEPAGEFCE